MNDPDVQTRVFLLSLRVRRLDGMWVKITEPLRTSPLKTIRKQTRPEVQPLTDLNCKYLWILT